MTINELMILVFLINIPFGYMRSKSTKFSKQWMMAVHIPVPFVFVLRIVSGLNWTAIPLLIISDIAGQIAGGKLKRTR
jgi:L-cystine uptake protein TcyP (sodium:dicarboxylate symporter family)